MFTVALTSAGQFIKMVEALAALIDVGTFQVNREGIAFKAMDPSHVAMVSLFYPAAIFSKYECKQPTPLRLNIIDLNRFMKRGLASDQLEWAFDSASNKLKIQFQGKGGKGAKHTFRLGLISDSEEEEESPEPNLELKATLAIPWVELNNAVKDAAVVGDYITFTAQETNLVLEASGDTGDVLIEMRDFDTPPKIDGAQRSTYSIEFLGNIIKGVTTDKVKVSFGNALPIQIESISENGAKFSYWLAPKVEEGDEETPERKEKEGEKEGEGEEEEPEEKEEDGED